MSEILVPLIQIAILVYLGCKAYHYTVVLAKMVPKFSGARADRNDRHEKMVPKSAQPVDQIKGFWY